MSGPIGTVNRLRAGRLRNHFSILGRGKKFSRSPVLVPSQSPIQ